MLAIRCYKNYKKEMFMIKKEDAIYILTENISSVRTVKDWATLMGYDSEKYFSRKSKTYTRGNASLHKISFM